jgi:POT family proton-dependent oligopeptide transporter
MGAGAVRSDKMPSGIPYIVGNEAAERFSYYGMRTILTVFMTQYLMNSSGQLDVMSEGDAKFWFHISCQSSVR